MSVKHFFNNSRHSKTVELEHVQTTHVFERAKVIEVRRQCDTTNYSPRAGAASRAAQNARSKYARARRRIVSDVSETRRFIRYSSEISRRTLAFRRAISVLKHGGATTDSSFRAHNIRARTAFDAGRPKTRVYVTTLA